MNKKTRVVKLSDDAVISKMYLIRDTKVMMDNDLAELYKVTTGNFRACQDFFLLMILRLFCHLFVGFFAETLRVSTQKPPRSCKKSCKNQSATKNPDRLLTKQ
ncbi:MAG: hypothetical protein IM638_12095 [Bacteroidetes bacterium]|nr:hypothetical protein [Bacteroidota bacterium]